MAIPVRDIDWSDPLINRSGIIPYTITNGSVLIGLAVTAHNAALSFIGGNFDSKQDHDLISTAIREYNEEIGDNLEALDVDSIERLYAIKSSDTIQILFPMKGQPVQDFRPTDEVEFILWISPQQLLALVNTHDVFIPNMGEMRAFLVNKTVGEIARILTRVDLLNLEYNNSDNLFNVSNLFRPVKIVNRPPPTIKVTMDELRVDSAIKRFFVGYQAVVLTDTHIGIMRVDRTCYVLPRSKMGEIMEILKSINCSYYLAFDSDKINFMRQTDVPKWSTKSLETDSKSIRQPTITSSYTKHRDIIKKLRQNTKDVNYVDGIVTECKIIHDMEIELHKAVVANRIKFSWHRASIYEYISLMNLLQINDEGIDNGSIKSDMEIIEKIREKRKYKHIDPRTTFDLLRTNNVSK